MLSIVYVVIAVIYTLFKFQSAHTRSMTVTLDTKADLTDVAGHDGKLARTNSLTAMSPV